jgi:hypothetical protein
VWDEELGTAFLEKRATVHYFGKGKWSLWGGTDEWRIFTWRKKE